MLLRRALRVARTARRTTPSLRTTPLRCLSTETTDKQPTERRFEAETASLLNIVSNALYTEREVFLRELLSNASDALEKLRQKRVANETVAEGDDELKICISVDKEKKQLVIEDSGVGMQESELAENLGTIALSGSRRFAAEAQKNEQDASAIIGKFGVGFYSAFMVASKVTVESKSYSDAVNAVWSSADGAESYTLQEGGSKTTRGTRVILDLKDDAEEYLQPARLREVVQKYSSFVSFPIEIDGELANTTGAVWAQDPREVEEKTYEAFYRATFKGAWDAPTYTLHFRADAPLDIKCVLFMPSFHTEKGGLGRLEPSVGLYSRKVLIENPCSDIAPEWCRFVKGVVDSEDLPLSISREKSQDKRLLAKIQDVVVRKLLRFLQEQAKRDRDKYLKWYQEFNMFLKEGACHDASRRTEVAKLLYFDSSKDGGLTSLDEYVARDSSEDNKIYYLHAPTRELALASPYYEQFRKNKRECLFVYNAIDDFVMSNIREHNGRQIVTAEAADFGTVEEEEEKEDKAPSGNALSTADSDKLKAWLLTTLPERLESVEATDKLVSSPAVVVDAESGAMRRMMAMVAQQADGGALPPLPPQKLRLNVAHPVVIALSKASSVDEVRATAAAHQLLDNAIVAAGLMDDPRTMLPRLNKLLELALKVESVPVETEPLSRTDALEKGAARKEASEAMDK